MFVFIIYGMKFVTAGKDSCCTLHNACLDKFYAPFSTKRKVKYRGQWLGVVFGFLGILSILGWDTLVHQNIYIVFRRVPDTYCLHLPGHMPIYGSGRGIRVKALPFLTVISS